MKFQPGDEVTLRQPNADDPLLLTICPHVRVVDSAYDGSRGLYLVAAPWTYVTDQWGRPIVDESGRTQRQTFGPIPERRLAKGWLEL